MKERLWYFRSFWIFPLTALALLSITDRVDPPNRIGELLWLFPLGVLIWTLLEYGLHRFVFHVRVPLTSPRLRAIVNSSQHLEHHASPRDRSRVLVHPVFGMVVSLIVYGILYASLGNLFEAAGVMSGVWAGFLYYEAVHYRVHFSLSPSGLIGWQRRAHFYHHFTNNKRSFGVTSPLWDYVFRSLPK
jgi:4-hydroxysphinganine ceramide fatty acyl 2-hydroxylase